MKLKELEGQYRKQELKRKERIRAEPKKFRRFWMWVWYLFSFPFIWLFYNIRDWHSAICVLLSFLLWSSSVWGFYLASFLCGWKTTSAGNLLFGIGTAVWVWWLSPIGSPFFLLVTFTAILMKTMFNRRRKKIENPEE